MPRHAAILFGLVAACSSADIAVRVDETPGIGWNAIGTYRWVEHEKTGDPRVDDTDLPAVIVKAVDEQLSARGIVLSKAEADVEVKQLVFFHRETITRHMGTDIYGEGYYGEKTGRPPDEVSVEDFRYGTLIVEMIETGTNRLLWRGRATAQVYTKDDPKRTRRRLKEAIRRMFAKFPRSAAK